MGKFLWILMVVGVVTLGGCGVDATRQEGEVFALQKQWLEETEPFVEVLSKGILVDGVARPQVVFHTEAARAAGVPESALRFVEKLVEHTNDVVVARSVVADDGTEIDEDCEIAAFLEAYMMYGDEDHGTSDGKTTPSARHCGGEQNNPAPCEPWSANANVLASKQAVVNSLINSGFHRTSGYASNYNSDDYTRPLNNSPCGTGVYRYQAIPEQRRTGWSFRRQHDLNPEIFNSPLFGNWPHYWWPTYVRWWHRNAC